MFIWEWSWGRNWIVILPKKRILVSVENFITDHSEEDRSELAVIRDILPKKDQQSFNNDNKLKLTLTSFFAIDFGVSKTERKKDGGNFELNTESSFQNKRASHRWAKTYSAHSLHVYIFMESHGKVLLSLRANKKFLFWRLTNDCQNG